MNKALQWIRKQKAQGYVPKFKAGDRIFCKNERFTLLAEILNVEKIEAARPEDKIQGYYKMRYLINNQSHFMGSVRAKDIRAIDAKYSVCSNPEMFQILYGKAIK